jgi:hydroxysqualene dehydroxylase
MNKKVIVIGGGIAGLSACVFLKEKGFDIELIEASPKLGGRASSYFDNEENDYFDIGQHIFAGWYENTFEYLKITGGLLKLKFQKTLTIKFVDSNTEIFEFKASKVPVPLNIIFGLIKYKALKFRDKIMILRLLRYVNKSDFKISELNTDELFKIIPQSKRCIKYFWEPLILAVFNSVPSKVSFEIFQQIIKIALKEKRYSALVVSDKNLYSTLIEGALQYFKKNHIKITLSERCEYLHIENDLLKYIETSSGRKIESDYFILALPYYSFRDIFGKEEFNKYFPGFKELEPSSVLSVHIFYDKDLPEELIPFNELGMLGVIDCTIQWIFKIAPDILSLTISAVDFIEQLKYKTNQEIYEMCLLDLKKLFNRINSYNIRKYKVIKEKKATFISDVNSKNRRTEQFSQIKNMFIAGDWVNTGLPSTIESAARSSKIISEMLEC